LTDGESISNILRIQSLSQPQTWRSYIWEGKCRHGSHVYHRCPSSEGWEGCSLRWNPTRNVQVLKKEVLWLSPVRHVTWCFGRVSKDF